MRTLALPDRFIDQDAPDRMYAAAGLDAASIVGAAMGALGGTQARLRPIRA